MCLTLAAPPSHNRPASIFDEPRVLAFFDKHGIKRVHAYEVWHRLASGKAESIEELGSGGSSGSKNKGQIPKNLPSLLARHFAVTTSRVVDVKEAATGDTTKLLVELQDGSQVETVIMHFGDAVASGDGVAGPKTGQRSTLCVSSQVGCRMGCKFCATGTMGLRGNLTAGEIVEQLYHARSRARHQIRNLVFMGMGEPLDNYDNVIAAIRMMTDARRFGLAPSRVSVSTVGVVANMKRLRRDAPGVQLALSLHAPNQALRERIVPTARSTPLRAIMAEIDARLADDTIHHTHSRKLMIEYVVIRDVNDTDACARELAELLSPRMGKAGGNLVINLIPYNKTEVKEPYETPERKRVLAFQAILREAGLLATVRFKKGDDIAGACGQLVVRTGRKRASAGSVDIEDIMSQKGSGAARAARKLKAPTSAEPTPATRRKPKPQPKRLWAKAAFGAYVVALLVAVLAYLGYLGGGRGLTQTA